MKRLYFIRHGQADRSAYKGKDDRRRPLTDEGRRKIRLTAETLRRMGWKPDLILTSPLTRARQTAEILAGELGIEDCLKETESLACGFGPDDVDRLLSRHSAASEVALVGHEPDFSWTISSITGGSEITCKKGSVARVDLFHEEPAGGQLVWLLPPKVLAARQARG